MFKKILGGTLVVVGAVAALFIIVTIFGVKVAAFALGSLAAGAAIGTGLEMLGD